MDLILMILYAFSILILAPFVIIFIYQWISHSPKFTEFNPKRSQAEIDTEKKALELIKKKYKMRFHYQNLLYIYKNLDYNNEKKMKEFLIQQPYANIFKPKKVVKKPKKVTTTKLTNSQKHWISLVNIRVNALPFDFIERTYTIDSMGEEHASEYINNEFKVPKDKRKEVALSRVEGLSSIRDYIKSKASKKQKFHYESSLKGALLYASSLGINIDKY